jgi:nucleoside-diphosphate-sugar epimerase
LKKKLLVIGGTGFLGSHVCREAIKKNYRVISVSTKKTKFNLIKKVKYIKCDISNSATIKRKLNFEVDYIINFGGYVDHSDKNKTYQSHFKGCKNLIDFYQKKKIKKFIQIGSSLEYGKTKSPHKEKIMTKKVILLKSIYAKSKLLSTNYCMNAFKKNFFPVIVLRPYLVYGPGQKIDRLIPFIISKSLTNKTFPCSSGVQLRNFLFVEDFVKAIFKTLTKKNVNGEIINIGSNNNLKVKKVILMIKNYLNSGKPMFGKIKLRKDESIKYYPSIKKAKNLINWKPLIQFEKGLIQTIKYYKEKSDKKNIKKNT